MVTCCLFTGSHVMNWNRSQSCSQTHHKSPPSLPAPSFLLAASRERPCTIRAGLQRKNCLSSLGSRGRSIQLRLTACWQSSSSGKLALPCARPALWIEELVQSPALPVWHITPALIFPWERGDCRILPVFALHMFHTQSTISGHPARCETKQKQ